MAEHRRRISDELRPYLDRAEAAEIDQVGELLDRTDPDPPPAAFRAELRARLVELEDQQPSSGWRPRRLGLAVASYVGSGLILLAIAATGAVG
ncbi:MAG: hypothetical protein ACR2N5_08270 [Solirubrobacterales bacterium]